MDVLELLRHAERSGVCVDVRSGTLRVHTPVDTSAIVAQIKEREEEVIASWWRWQAHRLLAAIADEAERDELLTVFKEAAAMALYEHDTSREKAEQIGLEALRFEMESRAFMSIFEDERERHPEDETGQIDVARETNAQSTEMR